MIRNFVSQMNRWLSEICGWLLSVLILLLCLDIFGRLFKQPLQGVAELAVFVMISAVYLGLSRCEEKDNHIKVTVFFDRMPPSVQGTLRVFNGVIQVVVASILVWAAYANLVYTYSNNVAISGTVLWSIWPVRLVIILGIIFYWLQSLLNLSDWIRLFFATNHRSKG